MENISEKILDMNGNKKSHILCLTKCVIFEILTLIILFVVKQTLSNRVRFIKG